METRARADILSKVRAANGRNPVLSNDSAPNPDIENANPIATEWSVLPRNYRRSAALTQDQLRTLLMDRLRDYDANVVLAQRDGTAQAVTRLLAARSNPRMLIPPGLNPDHLPPGVAFLIDQNLTAAEIDACGGVLTEATLAIAETGTIVLQNVPGQGRRAITLLPDYHLCLLDAATIVATVPEAMARLSPTAALATTFISGPSATADIEMIRIKGVHGPRFLDVILFQ